MITTAFIDLAYTVVNKIIGIFPTGTGFNSDVHSAISTLGGYVHILDPIFPIGVLLSCLLLIFGVEIALFGFRTFKWIFGHVPLVGGKGK